MTLLSGRLQLILAAAIFSTGGAAIKATTLTAWQVAGFRSGIAALTLWLLAVASRGGRDADRSSPATPATLATVAVSLAYAATLLLFVAANKLTTSANSIFLQSTSPLYILLLSPILLGERIRVRDAVFMAAVGLGLALFFVHREAPATTAPNPFLGNILAAISGLTWAFTVMGLRWLGARGRHDTTFRAMVYGNAFVFLATVPFALPVIGATGADWGIILYLGVVQIGVAYMLLASGIRKVTAFEAAILLLVEPALNPIWSWLVHEETPSAWALAGAVVIFGATTLRTWHESRTAVA